MTTSFPYPYHRHLAERVPAAPEGRAVRRWVLRDDNAHQYEGAVHLSESPVHLELHWKPDARGREQFIGLYRLDLARLLDEGYVRPGAPAAATADTVRVRFHRGDRGVIYLQSRSGAPGLAVGTVDMTL